MRKSLAIALLPLLALTGCASGGQGQGEAAPIVETVAVEQAAMQVKTSRQGDYLTEVKMQLSGGHGLNDIQLLAAGYEACLRVTESNKDAYREKVLSEATSLDAGLNQLVIAAGAKGLLCP